MLGGIILHCYITASLALLPSITYLVVLPHYPATMTEYDYSPEAVQAYHAKLQGVRRWVDTTNQSYLTNPFTSVPTITSSVAADIPQSRSKHRAERRRRDIIPSRGRLSQQRNPPTILTPLTITTRSTHCRIILLAMSQRCHRPYPLSRLSFQRRSMSRIRATHDLLFLRHTLQDMLFVLNGCAASLFC